MGIRPYEAFRHRFTLGSIKKAYEEEIAGSLTRGVDGVSPEQFRTRLDEELHIVYRKCNDGSYKFAPYRQVLIARGANRKPRQIAIPTVRDRVVLFLLKEVLQAIYPESVRSTLPNVYVRQLRGALESVDRRRTICLQVDIANFFPSINRDILFEILQRRTRSQYILTLLSRALLAPIVPSQYDRNQRDQYRTYRGVPQGLSISNILADVYGGELDKSLRNECLFYRRYVDDILILVERQDLGRVQRAVSANLAALDLQRSKRKGGASRADETFDFLGYVFRSDGVTVRESTVERHINNLAALVTRFRRGGYEHIENDAVRTRVFLEDLNERITGAISENRRYGWLFYFLEITDMELLYRIDAIVVELLSRVEQFGSTRPSQLKRTVRAYYHAKHTPEAGYIRNYDAYGFDDKRRFLSERNELDGSESPVNIERKFDRVKERHLRALRLDPGTLS